MPRIPEARHDDTCWRDHHACAIRRVEDVEAELERWQFVVARALWLLSPEGQAAELDAVGRARRLLETGGLIEDLRDLPDSGD